jgi:hypothetical protein
MTTFILDRRFITGPIDDDVPSCVLVDIANGNGWINPEKYSHGILMDNIMEGKEGLYEMNGIIEKDIIQINKEFLRPHASKVASFVNSDRTIAWSLSELHTAFIHMIWIGTIDITSKRILHKLPENIVIGPITMENPFKFNACMLYRLCRFFNIRTRPSMTLSDMCRAINLVRDINFGRLIIPKNALPKPFKAYNYVNFLLEMDGRPPRAEDYNPAEKGTFDVLCKFYDNLSINAKILSRLSPNSHEEAVIIAALTHNMDISTSTVPILELDRLNESKNYIPVSKMFRARFKRNPAWFSLKRTYSTALSMVYDNKALEVFVRSEAIPEEEYSHLTEQNRERRDGLKNLLFQARLSNTFYHGWHPDCINTVTPIELDDLTSSDVDIVSTISYGSSEYGRLTVYKTSELADHFSSAKVFSNPIKITENFSSIAIKKLKLICKDISSSRRIGNGPSFTQEQKTNFATLLASIDIVEAGMITLSVKAEDLKTSFADTTTANKELLKTCLRKLLEMGMCMRGWKVSCPESTFPLLSVSTVTPVGKQEEIDDNVNYAIHEFKDNIAKMAKINKNMANRIKNLPLVCVQKSAEGKSEFKQSVNPSDGITIWDRIGIVCQGNVSTNTSACIRISSNWITASAYYYMIAIGMPKAFNIEELSKIS